MEGFEEKKQDVESMPEALDALPNNERMIAWGIIKGMQAAHTIAKAAAQKSA